MSTEIREQQSLHLWGCYDELTAELVKARRALREGRANCFNLIRLRRRPRAGAVNPATRLNAVPRRDV